jgi:3-carboxy-cis,cis-muconate cycloisomerase
MLEVTSDRAWVAAMLQVEAALAAAECHVGLIPLAAAQAISAHGGVDDYDLHQLGRDAVGSANPVVPLVSALRAKAGTEAAPYVHLGATSQDILDTAMMVITQRALDLVLHDVDRAAAAAATLTDRHRSTLMAARTLMQQASVTTFGLKAAGWLNAITEARAELWRVRRTRLAIQFGGAVGTLAALSDKGLEVARTMATELDLADPVLPWHTARSRVVEVANALGLVAGVAGKVATDVLLMAQTEVGEVREALAEGKGGSSAMPQKQNPVQSVEILAAVRGINAQVATLHQAMVQEHERAAGAWQAEWPALTECLRLTGGAAARLADVLSGIQVDPGRMRRNLDLTGGLVMAESVVVALARRVDGLTARRLVDRAVATAQSGGPSFARVIKEDRQIAGYLDSVTVANALDPARYTGAADELIDRALNAYREIKE